MTEKELVQKCLAGHRDAQKTLFERYAGRLSAVCRRYAQDEEEARDFFQEGMIKIFANLGSFKFQSSLETWMTRIMINTAISALRRRKNIWESTDANEGFLLNKISLNGYEPEPEEDAKNPYSQIDPDTVKKLFRLLPPGYRAVLQMYVVDQMTHKEIALQLGISENTSKTQLLKARKKIREIVEKHFSIKI